MTDNHDIELPQGYRDRPFDYSGDLYTEGQVRAIVKADRKRRGNTTGECEPVAWKCRCTPVSQWVCVGHWDSVEATAAAEAERYGWEVVRLYDSPRPAELDKLQAEVERLRSMTAVTVGVGRGDGNLFVHGDHDSIKAVQALVFRAEQVSSDAISVVGMPEFDALIDHIYEHGTASEGVIPLANTFARALLARHTEGKEK